MSKIKKAVVVDDDLTTVKLVEEVLKELGFEVFTAEEGKKALELVREKKPDLLIIDLLLPGIHGLKVCNLIKEDSELGNIKIIAMSGVYKESRYRLEFGGDADEFMKKPFSVQDLELIVKKTGVI